MGRIDVHSHLLPGVDDGCRNVEESLACARKLVEAGYTHSFVTPHIWPNYNTTTKTIPILCDQLQIELDRAEIPLKLMPGGELNFYGPSFLKMPLDRLVTYGMKSRYAIFDFWEEELPDFFWPSVRFIQEHNIQPILAHPERTGAIQHHPELVHEFAEQGLLLQCNLECLGESELTTRRRLAEKWLVEGRYFMLGSDLHRIDTLDRRLRGLKRAEELVGKTKVDELTIVNPSTLL